MICSGGRYSVLILTASVLALATTTTPGMGQGRNVDLNAARERAEQLGHEVIEQIDEAEEITGRLADPLTSPKEMNTFDQEVSDEFGMQRSANAQVIQKGTQPYLRVRLTGWMRDTVSVEQNMGALTAAAEEDWRRVDVGQISGIHTMGFVRCTPVTSFSNCRYFKWNTGPNGELGYEQCETTDVGAMYCTNLDCAYQKNEVNVTQMLRDLANGMHAEVQKRLPGTMLSDAQFDWLHGLATYYVQDFSKIGTGENEWKGEAKNYGHERPLELVNVDELDNSIWDMEVAGNQALQRQKADPGSPYSLILAVGAQRGGENTSLRCTETRTIGILPIETSDVLHSGGGHGLPLGLCGTHCVDFQMTGSWEADSCMTTTYTHSVVIDKPDKIAAVILERLIYDDRIQVYIDNTLVFQGPDMQWDFGPCDMKTDWEGYPWRDITSFFKTEGPHEITFVVKIGDQGNAWIDIKFRLTPDLCKATDPTEDTFSNTCLSLATDESCVLYEEIIDGVRTVSAGHPTGQMPPPTTKTIYAPCMVTATRSWFEKQKTYQCARGDAVFDLSTEKERLKKILGSTSYDGSSLSYDDIRTDEEGYVIAESLVHELHLDIPHSDACIEMCEVSEAVSDTDVAIEKALNATHHPGDYRDAKTTKRKMLQCNDGRCVQSINQTIVKECSCDSGFTEAMVYLEILKKAGMSIDCTDDMN